MTTAAQLNAKYKEKLSFWFEVPTLPYRAVAAIAGNYVPTDTSASGEAFYISPEKAVVACIALTIIPVLPALTVLAIGVAILGVLWEALNALVEYPVAEFASNSQISGVI